MTPKNKSLTLKPFSLHHLNDIWQDGFSNENPEWTKWNAPYFNDYTPYNTFSDFKQSSVADYLMSTSCKSICLDEKAVGMVSKNWIDEATRWLEVGIVIYNPEYWHGEIGTKVLKMWTNEIFKQHPEVEHIGLTTWSGNPRMMHLAEKIGYTKEAQIRKVRYFQGVYYDSVKYGVLREAWEKLHRNL
ncbi:GNAT family N-acetyltransferase [Lactobacillus taiwanensis]|uniref:GNAT family N-acetyltransferase n=1 Tax=Lactobacillus taiwanensis TaxID=508451 RepID=UPI00129DEAE4|nr:GNAT family protein [Lactobacillus taiwanensis]MRM98673.1 N-acetyltransferase [Lactobacillus taiwanensis]